MVGYIKLDWKVSEDGDFRFAYDKHGVLYTYKTGDNNDYLAYVGDAEYWQDPRVPDVFSNQLGFCLMTPESAEEWCEGEAYLVDVALREHSDASFKWYHTQLDKEAREARELEEGVV